jgi:hypothetical protein
MMRARSWKSARQYIIRNNRLAFVYVEPRTTSKESARWLTADPDSHGAHDRDPCKGIVRQSRSGAAAPS